MDEDPVEVAEQARLLVIRHRVFALATEAEWFREALRVAFHDFVSLSVRASLSQTALLDREYALAHELLGRGWLVDPLVREGHPALRTRLRDLIWSNADALQLKRWRRVRDRFEKRTRGDRFRAVLDEVEHQLSAVALESLCRDDKRQSVKLSAADKDALIAEALAALNAGTHQYLDLTIELAEPEDWQSPPNPCSFEREHLSRFTDAEYLSIALYRLGGLADVGNPRPFVPEPTDADDQVSSLLLLSAWRDRFPVRIEHIDAKDPPLTPWRLPPSVAEHMLATVESWVKSRAGSHGERRSEGGERVSAEVLERPKSVSAAEDPQVRDRGAERAAERAAGDMARVCGVGDDSGDAKSPALPAGAGESASPALTANQSRVLQTMARFNGSRLLPAKMIAEEMDPAVRLSEETVRKCLVKLIEANLAERPNGEKGGTRLNNTGRRLAGKIAD